MYKHSLAVLCAATVALSGVVAPAATAAEDNGCKPGVISGDFKWGVSKEFTDYLGSPRAHGTWSFTSGAGHVADKPKGEMMWEVNHKKATFDGRDATLPILGSYHADAHDGVLKLDLSNLELETGGELGKLRGDLVYNSFDRNQAGAKPVEHRLDNVVLGKVRLDQPIRVTGIGHKVVKGTIELSPEARPAFANIYDALDGFTLNYSEDLKCPPVPTPPAPPADPGKPGDPGDTTPPPADQNPDNGSSGSSEGLGIFGALAGLGIIGAIIAFFLNNQHGANPIQQLLAGLPFGRR
ncbi:HtaA domain-containing protein [Corynebacterium argentoratense]|uniref:HtaA domain-containing protein n=1 Tax=Corynebacterium argentoratense TaxID=42817 RepID=UPI001F3DACF7|nr:HtaA domain-containing protein [Corynebacterium argentoratense]MCF1765923.1 HtaA domain-containing protein [Corynebacterium argentoratense]